jgi:GT2 family glycosyltransferase
MPRQGIYNAWNEGIRLAKRKYIHIATSDDSMQDTFLAEMINALDEQPKCGIAHCCLQIIDENDLPSATQNWNDYPSARYFGDRINQNHIRHAPHDGILHAFIKTVYHSINQLLIRTSVFTDLGLFKEDCGPIADFEWGMRASLFRDVVHVPKYLASWRVHHQQATTRDTQNDPATYAKLIEWVNNNIDLYRQSSMGLPNLTKRELTHVYTANRRYYSRQVLRVTHPFLYKMSRRLLPFNHVYLNGLAEARAYFRDNNLERLVEIC